MVREGRQAITDALIRRRLRGVTIAVSVERNNDGGDGVDVSTHGDAAARWVAPNTRRICGAERGCEQDSHAATRGAFGGLDRRRCIERAAAIWPVFEPHSRILLSAVDFSKREHLTVQPGGTQIVTSERRVTEGLDIVESEADVTDVRLVRSAWVASARAARRPRVVRLTARPRDPSTQERRKAARDSANDRGHIPRRAMRGISQSGRGGRRRGCTRGVGRALHGP
mmetsp:Transcript_2898/g.6501  ORF Transcript_2898/g.6501 Transcript_2898/m.6501 type:complete len:226 (+) Transcript_2898:62-739(+)